MQIQRLALTNFRNYAHQVWKPRHRISVLTGENGAGKTNVLEAVSLLAPGRGLRGASLTQLALHGASEWGVAAQVLAGGMLVDLGTGNDLKGGTRRVFQLDAQSVRSQGDIAQFFSCVWITPQMDRLFTDPGSARRRFLDRLVVALNPQHARELAAHERAVAQRNRLLAERPGETAWLAAAEDSMARHAIAITASRMALVDGMNHTAGDVPGFPRSDLALICPIGTQLASGSALQAEDWLREKLRASRDDDRMRSGSRWGAHRADLGLTDRASGRSADQSSSGQQKAMLLGVVLSHAELIARQRGDPPIILLDEPLVHLDARRREALLAALPDLEASVMLTGTDRPLFESLEGRAAFHRVSDNRLSDDSFPESSI